MMNQLRIFLKWALQPFRERLLAAGPLGLWFFWFLLFNLFVVQALSLLYFTQTRTYPETGPAGVFLFLYWCGHLFSLVFVIGLIWSLVIFIAPSPRFQRYFLALLSALLLIVLIADTMIYAQYRFHINLLVLDLFLNGHGQIISFAWQTWATMAAVGFVILAVEILISQQIWRRLSWFQTKRGWRRAVLGFYFFTLLAAHVTHVVADAMFYAPITRLAWVFPFAVPTQAQSFLAAHGLVDVEEYKKRSALKVPTNDRPLNYPQSALNCQPQTKKMNVLWIVVDSLRADALTADIMPNAFALAQKSQVFVNHFSGSNTTRYGVFNMFYGLPGVYFNPALLSRTSPVMVDEFQRQGYEFGIFGSAPLNKPEFDQTVFAKIPNIKITNENSHDFARDQDITAHFKDFLNRRDESKPFYGFLFYDSCHGFGIDPKFPKKFLPIWDIVNYIDLNNDFVATPFYNVYKNSAYFIDSLIGDVLRKLAQKHLDDSTIILISSDHGQEFNDNHLNYWGHNSNYSDAQTRVPLAIYWPGRTPQTFDHRTVHYDLAPTFMKELFQCSANPRSYSSGDDLFDKKAHPWLIMGRKDDFAIYRDRDIVVLKTNGDYEILDHGYHPINGAQLDGAAVLPALDELRRFF